ncbi:LytR family transcriptional regulator [Lachnospiraceae bacterium WCA-693-APC-MOT-I]|uniref:LytR family transcriptional regulator n=2 Tax=Velocimicrobium porci TaxID=2606634 RepID=A0A6L5Y1R3_9FIRM|nr:LytR family transcriptional regulator [Velocimicrobium porci]
MRERKFCRRIVDMNKKKKKSAASIFIRNFVRSVVLILVLSACGYGSYKITFLYYDKVGAPKDNKAAKIVKEYFGDVKVEDISKNLILSVEPESGQIKSMVLEIFNKSTSNFDYITIPMKTQFTLSNELYQKLFQAGCEAPQIIRLSKADEYFSEETLYQYMVILLEDYFGIDISYYTVVPQQTFREMFKKEERTITTEGEQPVTGQYSVYCLKNNYLEKVRQLNDADAWEKFIKESYETCESSLPLKGKLEYVESYLNGNIDCAYFHSIYGQMKNGYFEADKENSAKMIQELVNNTVPYSAPQNTESSNLKPSSSDSGAGDEVNIENLVVEILNTSKITGLAASYKQKLTEAGYQVASIGNYTQGTLTQSKIIVKDQGVGQTLLNYFPNAQVEVGTLKTGIDVQILLGTDAAQ